MDFRRKCAELPGLPWLDPHAHERQALVCTFEFHRFHVIL